MDIRQPTPRQLASLKSLTFVLCLVPLACLAWGAWTDDLGVNPIEFITRDLGTWTLNFLLLTLSITPLRQLTGFNWLIRLRRMLGLYAFFYVCLHLASYLWLDQFIDWMAIAKDIVQRPFISAGFIAFVLLVPLAASSTNAMVHRLGRPRWARLHRTAYAAAMLAVLHYWWLVKQDISQPLLYAAVLVLLLGWRAPGRGRQCRTDS